MTRMIAFGESSRIIPEGRFSELSRDLQSIVRGLVNVLPSTLKYSVAPFDEDKPDDIVVTDSKSSHEGGYLVQVRISFPMENVLTLEWLYFDESFRRQGYAAAVIKYLVDICIPLSYVFSVIRAVPDTCRILDRVLDGYEITRILDDGTGTPYVYYVVRQCALRNLYEGYIQMILEYDGVSPRILE